MEKRVLVGDDDECVADLVTKILQQRGYLVETASDGQEVLHKVRTFQPDLLVLDVIMPKENGYRVSRQIKKQEGIDCDPVPRVLLVTGRRLDDDPGREIMFMGFSMADDILYKPFEIGTLLGKVENLIGCS